MIADRMTMIFVILACIMIMVMGAAALLWYEAREREVLARVSRTIGNGMPSHRRIGLFGVLNWIGEWFRRFYSPASQENLRSVIVASGFNPNRMLPILLGAKIAAMVLLPVLGIALSFLVEGNFRIAIIGIGTIAGILGPEMILGFVRRRFIATVQSGTPDAIDLLVLCSESGMGLESALDRVSSEMHHSNPAMASILSALLDDLRVLPNRREAFDNLGARSGVDGLRRCGMMINQSMQYGTPLSDALRAVAAELRRDRMNKLEERAVKLPAKLIFPMVAFIMPAIYIVLLGASILRIYTSLSSLL
jgi:tight adherence protein C